jgi:dihydrofolate reductase
MFTSLDGFIVRSDGSMEWFEFTSPYERGIEEDAAQFLAGIDCYIMGSHTYELARQVGWPYGDIPVIVLTGRKLPVTKKNVRFYSGEISELLKGLPYQNTYLVGGAKVYREFLRLNLADELWLTTIPGLPGYRLSLFESGSAQTRLAFKDCKAYKNRLVETRYTIGKGL